MGLFLHIFLPAALGEGVGGETSIMRFMFLPYFWGDIYFKT